MRDGGAKAMGCRFLLRDSPPWLLGSWPQSALMFSPITRVGKDHQAYANTKSQQDWQCPPSTVSSVSTPKLSLGP